MVERLDEERLETLRNWGAGLSTSARDELRAAGKAILMLVDEIDRLEADLWNARAAAKEAAATATAEAAPPERQAPLAEPPPARKRTPAVEAPARDRQKPATKPSLQKPAAKPSQVLAMTLSERLARGRAPSEPAT